MTPQQQGEFEILIASGVDPLTALAAVADNRPRESWRHSRAWQAGLLLGMAIWFVVWLLWR